MRQAIRFMLAGGVCLALLGTTAEARNPVRTAFFSVYPAANGTQLSDLPSNPGHCGVCHFNFDGGGARNPYGLAIQVKLNEGLNNTQAIQAVAGDDSDADGFTSLIEITDTINFGNTPTFPGLSSANAHQTSMIPLSEIESFLTPTGGFDTTPPDVTVDSPDGGESFAAGGFQTVAYQASDASGISYINVYMSDDGGATYRPVALLQAPATSYAWFVPNRPGGQTRIRVEARDMAGNFGHDDSDGNFTILAQPAGFVPTTLRDMDMSGTQPLEGATLDNPDVSCASCHGDYDAAHEPWFNWRGSMMGQAARDPLLFACMAVAEQDAPSVGDLCLRCHTPGGWQEGRSVDTGGGLLTAKDRYGVQCDFCHRAVDHQYVAGVSPIEDVAVLETVSPLPLHYGNGQFINDPAPLRRGPYADAIASHAFVESPFHRSADLCGLCHDVSNPVFVQTGPLDYAPNDFDSEHPDMDLRNMFPIERTYSEWTQSEYATTGVYAPQFAGNKPDGIVSTCQDCHMQDVEGYGCNEPLVPLRQDLALHDFTGGNTFIPDILPDFYPGEVDMAQLQAGKARATAMLQKAATLDLTPETFGLTVRVTNETAHKLPSGYPEGRRIWLNVKAYDEQEQLVFESGAYDAETGVLAHDEQARIYEIHPGLSPGLATAIGLPPGKSFHFVLNDTIYSDNRIPPRGFTNAGFAAVQSPPVAHAYADGQYWDDTAYTLPGTATRADVTLYYQATSKEYVEFLLVENETNDAGQDLYDAWVAQGRNAPVAMAQASVPLEIVPGIVDESGSLLPRIDALGPIRPNPAREASGIGFALAEAGRVTLTLHAVDGRRVRTLVDEVRQPGHYRADWDGRGAGGEALAAGVYFVRLQTPARLLTEKLLVVR